MSATALEKKPMTLTMVATEPKQTRANEAHASLAGAFDSAASRWPNRVAITLGTESMTYRELAQHAARVAAAVRSYNLDSDALVAIHLDRSFDMVIAMLGVIQAGAAYLPIDASYPAARVLETLVDSSAALLLSDRAHAVKLQDAMTPLLMMGEIEDAVEHQCGTAIATRTAQREDLAYVIYTSGSTGKPKGVMVTHHNVLRLLEQTKQWFDFDEHDVWTMFHSFAFDFSVWEMWGCLLTGGRLVIVPFEVSRSPEDFYALAANERVTVLNQTPSAFSLFMQADEEGSKPLSLRCVIFGGEALTLRSLLPWFARHGDASPQLINMYGITETTVHVTYRRITERDAAQETDSLIGEPIPDLQVRLLDESLQPVCDGEVGELCIGGDGVARGYLGRPERTAERFVADPFGLAGAKLYRSGDLARRRADGELVYLGRSDRQVKINGFRIELGEIEASLLAYDGVAQVCVVAHTSVDGAQSLAAYFVADNAAIDRSTLSRFLQERLPSHMRPTFYVALPALPLTGNGKVDRDALPPPQSAPQRTMLRTVGTTAEQRIAAIWCDVLQTGSVQHTDNFFDIGGTSLRLISLRAKLQDEFGIAIPVTVMFECPTVRALAERLVAHTLPLVNDLQVVKRDHANRQRNSFARMRSLRSVAS